MRYEWLGAAFVAGSAVIAAWFTRRSSRDQTAVAGFTELVNQMRTERTEDRARIAALETQATRRHELAMAHTRWDRLIQRKMETLTDESFPDPPPLDE